MDSSSLFSLSSINSALNESNKEELSGVDFSGKSLKLDTEEDVKLIVDAINACPDLHFLTLTGNTLGVKAAEKIAEALEQRPEFKVAGFSDMFTGRMKTEIPPALSALGDGMIAAGAKLSELDLSDNAFGPIGVEGLATLLQSDVCSQLQELRLNNNGLGITGGRLLAKALSTNPRRLKVFIAGRNRLENDGATALAAVFKSMGTLEELAMPQNGIYHPGIKALAAAFKHNPKLRSLNLNDNTIGPKGAAHIAEALPELKNLKSINFGDCLLKSKGAMALAKAFKGNSVLLECLDVSHNEIGKEACNELVDSITKSPHSKDRLSRVVLAGNSLGNASNKKSIRDKLGSCAELSDGEDGSDDESDEQSDDQSEDESDDQSEDQSDEELGDSINESGNESVITNRDSTVEKIFEEMINLDETGKEKVQSDVMLFLQDPIAENLDRLGHSAAEVIDAHLQTIQDPSSRTQFYVEAVLCASALNTIVSRKLCQLAIKRADKQWTLAETMLRALALIKSEDKHYKVRWNLPASYSLLAQEFSAPHFPAALRDTLRFFIASKMSSMQDDIRRTIEKHPVLYQS